jgi:hypothetical protein
MISRRNVLAGLAVGAASGPVLAADPCREFYGNGYCTDYVNSRISPRQSGDGGSWPANMPREAVQRGDVAILREWNHVAYVEEVTKRDSAGNPTEVRISEMNWGRGLRPGTPSTCAVTSKFGIRSERTLKVSAAEFMRPGGYRAPKAKPKPRVVIPNTPIDTRTAGSTPPIRN